MSTSRDLSEAEQLELSLHKALWRMAIYKVLRYLAASPARIHFFHIALCSLTSPGHTGRLVQSSLNPHTLCVCPAWSG